MGKTNAQVTHLFAHHGAGNANSMSSDGTKLWSYNTVIAFWADDVMFISSNTMSPTTASKHLPPLRSAASHCTTFYSSAFSYGDSHGPTPRECIEAAAADLVADFKGLPRKRSSLHWAIENYEERRAQVQEMAARFNVEIPELPEATGDLKAKAKELEQQEQERRRERERKEEERREAKKREDAERFEQWLQGIPVAFPQSFARSYSDPNGTDYLKVSVDGKTVVTSQGAEAPLEHVRKAIAFYQSRITEYDYPAVMEGGIEKHRATAVTATPYQTNGHKIPLGHFTLDSIDEAGNVRAGCHRFTAAEIARFIEQWKEVL